MTEKTQQHRYRVTLPGSGELVVIAGSPEEAIRKYNVACGVLGTEHQHDVEQLD